MNDYHTMPDEHLRRRAHYDLDLAASLASGVGDREVLRMAHTIGAIERVLDEVDFAGDPATAQHIARIRARVEAYKNQSEAPR